MAEELNKIITLTQTLEDGTKVNALPKTVAEAVSFNDGKTVVEKINDLDNKKIEKLGKVPGTVEPQDFHLPYFADIKQNLDEVTLDVYTVNINDGTTETFVDAYKIPPASKGKAGVVKAPGDSTVDGSLLKYDAASGEVEWGAPSESKNQRVGTADETVIFGEDAIVKFVAEDSSVTITGDAANNQIKIKATADTSNCVQLLGNEAGSGQPYHFTYYYDIQPHEDKYDITIQTITLDNHKTITPYTYSIPAANVNLAGLMSKDDKIKLDALRNLLKGDNEHTGTNPIRIPYYFDVAQEAEKIKVTARGVYLDNDNKIKWEPTENYLFVDIATEGKAGLVPGAATDLADGSVLKYSAAAKKAVWGSAGASANQTVTINNEAEFNADAKVNFSAADDSVDIAVEDGTTTNPKVKVKVKPYNIKVGDGPGAYVGTPNVPVYAEIKPASDKIGIDYYTVALDEHKNALQEAAKRNDLSIPTAKENAAGLVPGFTSADKGKAVVVKADGTGLTYGEAGKVDDVTLDGTSVVDSADKKAKITTDESITSTGGQLKVNLFNGLQLNATATNGVEVKAGNGIIVDATGVKAKADARTGITTTTVDTNGIQVKYNADKGITADGDGIAALIDADAGLTIDSTKGIEINAGNGLEFETATGTNKGKLKVKAGNGLEIDATNGLQVKKNATEDAIVVDADGVKIDHEKFIEALGNEEVSGEPYKLPYYFYTDNTNPAKIKVIAKTLALTPLATGTGNRTKKDYDLTINLDENLKYSGTVGNETLALNFQDMAESGWIAKYVAALDSNKKLSKTQLPDSIMGALRYAGKFTKTSAAVTAAKGDYYIAECAPTETIDHNPDGTTGNSYVKGDWAICRVEEGGGFAWDKISNQSGVSSIQVQHDQSALKGAVEIYGTGINIDNKDGTNTTTITNAINTKVTAIDALSSETLTIDGQLKALKVKDFAATDYPEKTYTTLYTSPVTGPTTPTEINADKLKGQLPSAFTKVVGSSTAGTVSTDKYLTITGYADDGTATTATAYKLGETYTAGNGVDINSSNVISAKVKSADKLMVNAANGIGFSYAATDASKVLAVKSDNSGLEWKSAFTDMPALPAFDNTKKYVLGIKPNAAGTAWEYYWAEDTFVRG